MSHEQDKFNHSKRLHADETAIKKQTKIAKEHRVSEYNPSAVKQPHRFNKRHAMDCGNPECALCGNPRHLFKDSQTIQEKSFKQTEKWETE